MQNPLNFLADQVKDYVMLHVRLFAMAKKPKLRFTRKQD